MLKELDHKLSCFRVSTKSFNELLAAFKDLAKEGDIYSATITFIESKKVFQGNIVFKPEHIIKRKE